MLWSVTLVRKVSRAFDASPEVATPWRGNTYFALYYRRVRPDGAISASTKTISFTGCQFDPAQFTDAEAAGAFARRPLSHRTTQVQIDTRCPAQR